MPTCPNCDHTFEVQASYPVDSVPSTSTWTNFVAMIDDVHAHVLSTQRHVTIYEDPRLLQFGYEDPISGRRWRIRLSAVKETLAPPRSDQMQAWSELVRTSEGRLQLANMVLPS